MLAELYFSHSHQVKPFVCIGFLHQNRCFDRVLTVLLWHGVLSHVVLSCADVFISLHFNRRLVPYPPPSALPCRL